MIIQQPRIAVVSMAGVFPGADNTGRFIDNILNKKDALGPVPDRRWAAPPKSMVGKAGPDRALSDRAGLIHDFKFDSSGLDLPPDLITALDPVHHLVLSAGRTALDSCVTPSDILERTGVILAAIALPTQNSALLAEKLLCTPSPAPVHPYEALGATVVSSPAAILARALGCRGASFTLDAACASSLFSIKLACEHLVSGRTDMMIAGGVSRPDSLYTQVGFSQLAALSPTGRCAPFDHAADGLVVGEGTGIVVLKRLEDAKAHNDTIYGVITGWGCSNDVQGNLVAPASDGQIRAMAAAYSMAGWSLSDIQYLECHGSGTPKGDEVELATLAALADQFGCQDHPLAIGSVKSMIGHLLTAAGAAGFIKTLLAMDKGTLPPSLHFSRLPDNSPARQTGIRVQADAAPWQPAGKDFFRRAGISAFGFGGINAHILVEACDAWQARPVIGTPGPSPSAPQIQISTKKQRSPQPCAIVGMAVIGSGMETPQDLDRVLSGRSPRSATCPGSRWRNPLTESKNLVNGLFMDRLEMDLKAFHIPPNQFPDILAQHLVMLKAARSSLVDAGITPRPAGDDPSRLRMGGAFGIDFDFGAADFYLRWHHNAQPDKVKDSLSPPLTFDRTLGALGAIVASRIAREFKLGGPCFTLSAGAASGVKALETGMLSLDAEETDIFICGAVDMAGDLATFSINQAQGLFSKGELPAEGAVALILKRLDRALEDEDRIHAVIQGIGAAGGDHLAAELLDEKNSKDRSGRLSFDRALAAAGMTKKTLALAIGPEPGSNIPQPMDLTSLLGHAGSASGLFSVAAACRMLTGSIMADTIVTGPTAVGTRTTDGACAHVILAPCPSRVTPQGGKAHPETHKTTTIMVPVSKPQIPQETITLLNPAPPRADRTRMSPPKPEPLIGRRQTARLLDIHDFTARAHERFLELSSQNMEEMGRQVAALAGAAPLTSAPQASSFDPAPVFLDRAQCLEYAVGKAGKALGPAFDIIDTYPVRVRLPAEPLMLVDRIMRVEGEMLSLTSGKVVTQHDVLENAWYLDGGKAPVSISIEAGQADLFLCAWLGIDHVVKGTRKYRLLDAKVTFHRPLPEPGETIEYHIEIDRFLRQGEIHLFFFHYKGYIDGLPFISMRDGCAGFFTEDEVKNSGGIILKKQEAEPVDTGLVPQAFVPMEETALSDHQVEALRQGDFETAFGPGFKGVSAGQNQWLPGGAMTLIHRVVQLSPTGGRFGLGRIVAEADIRSDDWFLTCHFIDDMVMPGTLMYECCAHALRIFIQRMGWIFPDPAAHFDVLPANESDLKCRGPVTPNTQKARYDIEIKEIGYDPAPFVVADAHMFSDDLRIVLYKNMGMKLSGVTRRDLMAFWRKK